MSKTIDKTLSELLHNMPFKTAPSQDIRVSGISYASNKTHPGDVFFCVVGTQTDGHAYAADALARGAVALVGERELPLDIPQFIVTDSRKALALASSNAFDNPSSKLQLAGITGTNGKTTTAYLVEWALRKSGRITGLIGTVETRVAGKTSHAVRTTPESLDLQDLFAQMVDASVQSAVMEVSSHAIDLDRIAGTVFEVAAFSNLTQDHLDYHKTMESYFQAKCRLFTQYGVKKAAVCIDDDYGICIAQAASAQGASVLTCGFAQTADVFCADVAYGVRGTSLTLHTPFGSHALSLPLVGRFNVENILLATAICLHLGLSLDEIAEALQSAPQVPGRFERVISREEKPFGAFVDYAHTPDAIEKAVAVAKGIAPGRTIIVFGCGGDRDATKRPKMGAAALGADFAVVTSDNPRTEDPEAIIADILPGMREGEGRYEVLVDRRKAIARALSLAGPGDLVLVAGKGHEDYQLIGDKVLSFDDRLVVAEEMDAL